MMVRMTKPQIGERLNDPAAGTFGFMVAANDYLSDQTDEFFDLSQADRKFEKEEAFSGMELVPNTHRLALMNQYLHGMDGRLDQGDSLSAAGKWMKNFDVILTNPPFGTKKGGERATRDDLTYETSNKQLNFLQIIYNSLKKNGKGRKKTHRGKYGFSVKSRIDFAKDGREWNNIHSWMNCQKRLPGP